MTLGELVFEGKGKVTSQRSVKSEKGEEKMEASFIRKGKLKGMDVTNSGTFWTMPIGGGAFYGEAKGVFTTGEGETITYTAQGLGRYISESKLRFTGSDFLYTSSTGNLSHLNNTVGVFEVEVDTHTGEITGKTFEWK
ncbi:MAG: hypothetical protein M3162_02045 [Thermoproteota archaeon]|nr:hypothetical protein [Thermoproteota archaeon]